MNKNRSQASTQITLAALIALLPTLSCKGANIIWGTPTAINSDTDVSTTGTFVYAFSFGNTGVASTMVNGVTFAPFAAPNGDSSQITIGSVTLTLQLFADYYRSTLTETGSNLAPFSNLSSAYRGLLQSAVSDGVNPSTTTLTLGGLTIGDNYQIQLWVNESASFTNNLAENTKTLLTAGNSTLLDSNNLELAGGIGQWVIGSFVASGNTQAIDIAGANPAGASPILNGFQLRTVPEPASISLMALGIVLLFSHRRRIYSMGSR